MSNTFGTIFRLTCFGESHGPAIGGVVDGVPAGLPIDEERLQRYVARRRPGQSIIATARDEADRVELLSGIYRGVTLGSPIGFVVRNTDRRSGDYDELTYVYRPSHADFTYEAKYGLRDPRGGGRASARETVSRMVAGAIADQLLSRWGVTVKAYTSQVGQVRLEQPYTGLDLSQINNNATRCPDATVAGLMEEAIARARAEGDTLGGVVTCVVSGVPAGVGEPVSGKLHALLAGAMMSINAAKGFEYGDGFAMAAMRGSEAIDPFAVDAHRRIITTSNHSGGIQGGITNGNDIVMRVAFKPVPTLMREVSTVNAEGEPVTMRARGRHDPCVVPRAVPIVEAMAAMTLADAMLLARAARV